MIFTVTVFHTRAKRFNTPAFITEPIALATLSGLNPPFTN